jgi:hypothetical protein
MSTPLETRQELRPVSGEFVPTWFESLENRRLLSATPGQVVMQPALSLAPQATTANVKGYTPAQIDKAYGFDAITLDNGLGGTIKGDGSGQTIAIVDAYNDPNIQSDLKTFDKQFSLADPNLSVINQTGSATNLPKTDAGWSQEISLDVEWAHAVAPKANIMLVEARSASLSDLLNAVDTARNAAGVSVVSMSWGTNEFFSESNLDGHFTTPAGHQGVTFVASSGDNGSWFGPTWPSVSSNVLAVGGTTMTLNSNGTIANETGWSGSGGGVSDFESEPGYQSQYGNIGGRGAPDVSINANPFTGYAVYDSLAYQGSKGWQVIGGTSAGAPQWAALIAIANQGRAALGAGTLDGVTGTLPGIYSLYNSTDYGNSFNDALTGRSSWFYSAGGGWDPVTGLGSPKGDAIADALSHFGLSAPVTPTVTVTTTTTHKTAQPQFEPAPPVPVAQASLPVAPTTPTLFSSVQLRSATVDSISTRATASRNAGIDLSGDSGGSGIAGSNRTGRGGAIAAFGISRHSDESAAILPSNPTEESQSSTLRHLLQQNRNGETVSPAKPKSVFAPSTYDAASLAASRDESDDMLSWKQIAALVGTTILVGSYVADSQRRKREIQTI